jgi:hypothetical protein
VKPDIVFAFASAKQDGAKVAAGRPVNDDEQRLKNARRLTMGAEIITHLGNEYHD